MARGDVLHPDDAERTIAAWKECVRPEGLWDIEHRFRGVDGQWHPVLARGVPVRDEHGRITCWAGINLDISRLKKTKDALRRSIAEIVGATLRRTRQLARGLHPAEFDSTGLVSELRALAAQTNIGVRCKLECPKTIAVPGKGAALQLFRIAQEAVSNALKHADAQTISIDLRKRRDRIVLAIADDGKGLPERPGEGLRMRSMMHRPQMIGATFEVKRSASGGTQVVCSLPLKR